MRSGFVRPRANMRSDRAGDPLDGLVNMFDLGIVLAVAFLIAALEAHNLTHLLIQKAAVPTTKQQATKVSKKQQVVPITPSTTKVMVRNGKSVGTVYQLPDGSLVFVKKK